MVRHVGLASKREWAEAKADQTIKAARPRWGWFILFMMVVALRVWFIALIFLLLLSNC